MNEVTDNKNTETTGNARTLNEIRALLRGKGKDYKSYPKHYHEVLGTVYIGKLSSSAYNELESFSMPNDDIAKWTAGQRHDWSQQGRMRVMFKNAIYLESGEKLENEDIEALIKGDYGAENHALMLRCEEVNPERSYIVTEVSRLMLASTYFANVINFIAQNDGASKLVALFGLEEDTNEHQAAREELARLMDIAPVIVSLTRYATDKESEERAKESERIVKETVEETLIQTFGEVK